MGRKLSTLSSFFKFLCRENYIKTNIIKTIPIPKKTNKLPAYLSVDEVFRLLEIPRATSFVGARDKAMLEILYACGLRVSELVTLNFSQVITESNFLRVMGKGSKERIIPINDYALSFLKIYIEDFRSEFVKDKKTDS